MVVGGQVLDGRGVDLHVVGEVGDKYGKEQGEYGDERRDALPEGDPAQDARLGALGLEAAADVAAVDDFGRMGAVLRERAHARRPEVGRRLEEGLATRALVAGAEEQADDDEAREQRAAALAHEGEGDARERQEFGHAAHDEEGLEADDAREANGREGGGVGLGARGRGETADAEEHEEDDDGRAAEKARLLGDGREDEVGLDDGDERRHALSDARAREAAVGDGVERLDDLVAAPGRVLPGVEPDVNARLDVAEEVVAEHEAYGEQAERDDHVAHAAGGHEEHDDEEDEEEQGAAQVSLEDHEQEADAPHDEHGEEHAEPRKPEGPEPHGRDGERLSVAREVEREEEDDENLCELAGLEGEGADDDPELGSVDLRADEHGQEQKRDADDAERVLVPRKLVEVPREDERGDHGRDREEQPDDLALGVARRQARDEGDADAREHEHDRQYGWVRPRGESPDGEVRHGEGGEESDGHAER